MRGLIFFFFFVTFFFGLSRTLLELFIKPRDMVLLKFSATLMGVSVFFFFMIIWLDVLEGAGRIPHVSDLAMVLLFLTGAFLCGWMGLAWLKNQK